MGEPITKAEFDAVQVWDTSHTPEGDDIRRMEAGTGLKWPCRWNHIGKTHMCSGASLARAIAKRSDWTVTTRCKDKVLYVWRLS